MTKDELKTFHKIQPDAAIFTAIDPVKFIDYDSSETDTSSETDETTLPEPLTALYDPTTINLEKEEITNVCQSVYEAYKKEYNDNAYANLSRYTKIQAQNPAWMTHRAGRVTASILKEVFCTNENTKTSQSLVDKIMQYKINKTNKYTQYGIKMEPIAKQYYVNEESCKHKNFSTNEVGFLVKSNQPFLGASPDGLVNCSCHGKRVLEIKCPYTYRNGLNEWQTNKDFPIDCNNQIKIDHKYHYQVQLQMYIYNVSYADFLVYSPSNNGKSSILISVKKDDEFITTVIKKVLLYFTNIILPEIVTRKNDILLKNDRKTYCICKRPSFGKMIRRLLTTN